VPYIAFLETLNEFGKGYWRDVQEKDVIYISRVLDGLCNESYYFSFIFPSESYEKNNIFKKYLELRIYKSKVEKLNNLLTRLLIGERLDENDICLLNEFAASSTSQIKTVIDILFMQMVSDQ
jgi:hypothetical protein